MFNMSQRLIVVVFFLCFLFMLVIASPNPLVENRATQVQRRTTAPFFPDTPVSCPICAQNYGSINGCAQAAPVLANFSTILFNPGAFIDVINCVCLDTFQAVFPQCVDCFIQTNQTDVLQTNNLPAVLNGVQKICALQNTLTGNVTASNANLTAPPAPTATSSAGIIHVAWMALTSSLIGAGLLNAVL